jgi:DHA1 family inner membrane transport protein
VSMRPVLRNGSLWLLSLTFGLFNILFTGFTTFMPTYLNTVHNVSLVVAAQWAALGALGAMILAPFAGLWSDRIGSRKIPYLVGLVLAGIGAPLAAVFTGNTLFGLIVFEGMIAGLVPTNIFSAAVEVVGDERLGGLAMGVIMVGQNGGQLLGPVIFGALVESAWGWPLAFGGLALVALAAIASGAIAKLKDIRPRSA